MTWSLYWTGSIIVGGLLIISAVLWLIAKGVKGRILQPRKSRQSFSQPKLKDKCFDIGFTRLGLVLPNGKQVLDGVSGAVRSGKTTAVMGPSGSGKTTFLTTLAGRATYGTAVGRIDINGVEDSLLKYPKLVGFVPQEDVMHRDLTVEENLLFSARTRLPSELSFAAQRAVVDEMIDLLGLSELRDSVIGDEDVRGISGGQRKRVNIGIELCADPTVLFLDEPTSGLDSSSSKEICGCLQRLASSTGMTIVAVIHSPRYEIFEMFDDILLLGKGGSTVYLGPSKSALRYFSALGFQCGQHSNPADFMLDVIAGDVPRVGFPDFQPSDLFALWEQHRAEFSPSASSALPASLPTLPGEEEPDLSVQREERAPLLNGTESAEMATGSWQQFLCCFVIFFFFPPFLPIAMYCTPRTRRGLGGAVLGAALITASSFVTMLIVQVQVSLSQQLSIPIKSGEFWMAPLVAMVCLLWAVPILVAALWHLVTGKDLRLLAHFMSGAYLQFFFLPVIWFKKGITPKERYAASMGFASSIVVWNVIFMLGVLGCIHPVHSNMCNLGPSVYLLCWFLGIGGAILIVNFTRYRLVSSTDRQTTNSFVQGFFVFSRAITQQMRYPLGFVFDLFLPILSAVFLGLIFHGRTYTGPIISELFPDDKNMTCPPANMTVNPKLQNLCPFLLLPADDPFLPAASLTSMAIGLAAVASSIRVFAAETVIFKREHRAKLSTEAYYIGKSMAHLANIALATLCFTLCFHSFVVPLAVPFWKVYLFYFMVYFTCAGLAYLVSFLVPPHLAQLAGVLMILVFMMFSGANPTLSQLKQNKLAPIVMVLPSYVSLFRWTNELYYLFMVEPYNPLSSTLALYGYSRDHMLSCAHMIVLLAFSFRLFAYVAVVRQEV